MSWRLGLGVGVVAAASIAAAVIAVMSVAGTGGAEHVRSAIRWPTGCTKVTVQRPSNAPIVNSWGSATVQSADIVCGIAGPRVSYAQFKDDARMTRAIAAQQPSKRYCLIGTSIVIDGLTGVDPIVFTDMCQSLGGTYVARAR